MRAELEKTNKLYLWPEDNVEKSKLYDFLRVFLTQEKPIELGFIEISNEEHFNLGGQEYIGVYLRVITDAT